MLVDAVPDVKKLGLKPQLTGLNRVVWLRRRGDYDGGIIIQVSNTVEFVDQEMVDILIDPVFCVLKGHLEAIDIAQVTAWIGLNQDVIEGYWDDSIPNGKAAVCQLQKLNTRSWAG